MTTFVETHRSDVGELPAPASSPAAPAGGAPLTVIRPSRGWQAINFRELWRFHELLYFLAWRDVKVRYKQTVMGAAWALLQPALMMVVFTLFFARMAGISSGTLPYALFVYAGLLPWIFFASAVANAGQSVVGSERLITKVYFPRLAIPLASVGAAAVDFIISFGLLAVLMAWYRVAPGPGLLLAPLIFAAIVLTAVGVGTLLAALNVAYRDFRYVIPFLLQVWMFATPAIYMVPQGSPAGGGGFFLRILLAVNPMTGLVAAFRAAILGGAIPWAQLAASSVLAVLLFLVGCFCFRKVEDGFADMI